QRNLSHFAVHPRSSVRIRGLSTISKRPSNPTHEPESPYPYHHAQTDSPSTHPSWPSSEPASPPQPPHEHSPTPAQSPLSATASPWPSGPHHPSTKHKSPVPNHAASHAPAPHSHSPAPHSPSASKQSAQP